MAAAIRAVEERYPDGIDGLISNAGVGPFPISGVKFMEQNVAWYFIVYHGKVVPVVAYLSSVTEDGKIDRLNILPM